MKQGVKKTGLWLSIIASVIVIFGGIGWGVSKIKDAHILHEYEYTQSIDGKHIVTCKEDGCDYSDIEDCTFKDGKCELCGATEPAAE